MIQSLLKSFFKWILKVLVKLIQSLDSLWRLLSCLLKKRPFCLFMRWSLGTERTVNCLPQRKCVFSAVSSWSLGSSSVPARDAAQVSLAHILLSAQDRIVMTIASGKLSHHSLLPWLPVFLLELQIFSCTRLWPLYSLALLSLYTSLTPLTIPELPPHLVPLQPPWFNSESLSYILFFPLSPCPRGPTGRTFWICSTPYWTKGKQVEAAAAGPPAPQHNTYLWHHSSCASSVPGCYWQVGTHWGLDNTSVGGPVEWKPTVLDSRNIERRGHSAFRKEPPFLSFLTKRGLSRITFLASLPHHSFPENEELIWCWTMGKNTDEVPYLSLSAASTCRTHWFFSVLFR